MHGGKTLFQSKCGNDAGLSIKLCLTVYIGQDRNEEVHVGNGEDLNRGSRGSFREFFQYESRVILFPALIKSKIEILKEGHLYCRTAEDPADLVPDRFKETGLKISVYGNDKAMIGWGYQVMQSGASPKYLIDDYGSPLKIRDLRQGFKD